MDERLTPSSSSTRSGRRDRFDRRRFLASGAGALAALFALRGRPDKRVEAHDNCFWRVVQGPICVNGRKREYRCLICCGGGICEQVQCGWFDTGPC